MKLKLEERVPIEVARENFEYNEHTGELFRLIYKQTSEGKILKHKNLITNTNSCGYVQFTFGPYSYMGHQLAWYLTHGNLPERPLELNHKNRMRTDNRIDNLEITTKRKNNLNKELRPPKYGEPGITYRKDINKLVVKLTINGKTYHGGFFEMHELHLAQEKARELRRISESID